MHSIKWYFAGWWQYSLACMSWPWRPNTCEKGLRLQVSISSMAARRGKVLRLWQRQVHWGSASDCRRGSAFALEKSSPLSLLAFCKFAFEVTSQPLQRLFRNCHLFFCFFFLFYSCLPCWLQISLVPCCLRCRQELLLFFSWWEICAGLLSACSLVLQCGAASDREHSKHSMNKARGERGGERGGREREQWEGEACSREKADSPLTKVRTEMTACACVEVCVCVKPAPTWAAATCSFWLWCLCLCVSFIQYSVGPYA